MDAEARGVGLPACSQRRSLPRRRPAPTALPGRCRAPLPGRCRASPATTSGSAAGMTVCAGARS